VPKTIALLIFALVVSPHRAVNSAPPPSDPQAVALAAQSIAAMTGGGAANNLVLTENATRIAGSDQETGPATLMVKGFTESRVLSWGHG
jgi:hypothetical protein